MRVFNSALPQAAVTALYNETTTTAQYDYVSYPVSYNGTASNITYATGKFDNAAVFNGSNSTITISPPEAQAFNFTTPTSLSVWVNRNTTNRDFIIDKGNGSSGSYGWQFEYNYSEYVFQLNNTAGGIMDLRATASGTGSWEHIVVTYDSNQVGKIYLNGVLKATDTMSGTVSFNTNGVTIGKYSLASGYEFDGKLDQIRFFNTALPQSAVTALYNETTTTAQSNNIDYQLANPNSVAYYKMSDATDQLGNYNGTATNVNFNTEGKFGFAGAFNGSSSYISASGSGITGNNPFSVSIWVNSTSTGLFFFLGNSTVSGSLNTSFYISVETGGSYSGNVRVGNFGTDLFTSSASIDDGSWHHVAFTSNGTTSKLYIDGSESNTTSHTWAISASLMEIGRGTSSYYFNGSIDQVRIYDSALSAADVSTLYKEVECEPAAINALANFNTVLYTGNGGTQAVTGVGFKPDFSWVKNRNTAGNSHELADVIRGVDNTLNSNTTSGEYNNATYQFNSFDTDGITVTDDAAGNYAVNGNNETYVAWNWKAPLANLSTGFNGSSSSISTNVIPLSGTSFSISSWVYRNTNNTVSIIFGQSDQSNGTPFLSIGFDTNNNLELLNRNASSTGLDLYINSATHGVGINAWYNIVWTCSTTESKLYVNGVLKNTTSFTANSYSFPSQYIGARMRTTGVTNNWNGKIEQVRIYSAAITNTQVNDLYAESAASNNTLNYPAGAGCIAAYPLQTDAVDLSGNYSGASSNVTFGQPGYLTGNTDGTIPSTVAANVDAGFSIVSWTGNGNDATVGTGLGQQAELVITKGTANLATYNSWITYHKDLSTNYHLYLNTSDSQQNGAGDYFRDSAFTSEVFGLGNDIYGPNVSGTNMIAYCFHSVPGYSKIGSYTGTNAAGNFIYTGFQPRFLLTKRSSAAGGGWNIFDSTRGTDKRLYPNLSNAEGTDSPEIVTFNSNGFTFNTADSWNNGSYTYIYLAIA